jgi:hypothetical protein
MELGLKMLLSRLVRVDCEPDTSVSDEEKKVTQYSILENDKF